MKRLLLLVVGLVVAAPVGAYVYFNVMQDDPPPKLSLDAAGNGSTTAPASGVAKADLGGTWKPTPASQVGYRVDEVAFGQHKAAVGRTNKVTGTMTITGTTVSAVDLTVDMASISSDEPRRDNQYRGRIMAVSQFPTSQFKLTSPITAPSGSAGATTSVTAKGELTLRGATKPVVVALQAKRQGDDIAVSGSIPIKFADWGIPNPTFGPVTTEDLSLIHI